MSVGMGILLMTVGAILLFALTAGSPHWLNLKIVGVILILAGVLGLALPRLAVRARDKRMRRWVLPGQLRIEPPAGQKPGARGDGPPLVREFSASDPPTLADDVLGLEHDPPV
jgi:hypothetical protein